MNKWIKVLLAMILLAGSSCVPLYPGEGRREERREQYGHREREKERDRDQWNDGDRDHQPGHP